MAFEPYTFGPELAIEACDRCQIFSLDPYDPDLDLDPTTLDRLIQGLRTLGRDWEPSPNHVNNLVSAASPVGRVKDSMRHGDVLKISYVADYAMDDSTQSAVFLYHEDDQRLYRAKRMAKKKVLYNRFSFVDEYRPLVVPSQFSVPLPFPPKYWTNAGLTVIELSGSDLLDGVNRVPEPKDVFRFNGHLTVLLGWGYPGIAYYVSDWWSSDREVSDLLAVHFLATIANAKQFRAVQDKRRSQDWILELVPP